jgi:integrase
MWKASRRARRGEGKVYKRGKLWAVRWTERGVRHFSGGYLTPDDAEQVRASIAANIQAGRQGMKELPPPPSPRFDQVVDDWFASREEDKHRSVGDDRSRWNCHLKPLLAHRPIDTVDSALLLDLVRDLGSAELAPATIQRVLHLLSAFYRWAVIEKHAKSNPVHTLLATMTRKQREQLRSTHDPRDTPFVQQRAKVGKLFRALPPPVNIAYALSALAGLRPGEVLGLRWEDVDLEKGSIRVQRQVRNGTESVPKNGRPRDVPILPSLLAVLKARRKKVPTAILVAPPLRSGGRRKFLGSQTIKKELDAALEKLKLPAMTFYEAGRHTFASQWVLAGLDIYRLSKIMGHSSVVVTQRYAHLTDKHPAHVLAAADIRLAG